MSSSGKRSIFAVANAVFGLLFIVSALLQLNDPDPWAWAALYAVASVACFVRLRAPVIVWIVLLAALAWAVWLAPTALPTFELRNLAREMKAETPSIETSRELLGLLIIAGWMAVLAVRRTRSAPGRSRAS